MTIEIILNNNQYPWVYFKTHWVAIGVRTFDIFMAQLMFGKMYFILQGNGLL
jgi:hypothetical protein